MASRRSRPGKKQGQGAQHSSSSRREGSSQSTLTNSTALALCPPTSLWIQIDKIRKGYDKAYGKWPPHMNLSFPFVHSKVFSSRKSELEEKLETLPPFTITLSRFCTLDTKKKKEQPHVTVGQAKASECEALIKQKGKYQIVDELKLQPTGAGS
eukprot:jgi/Bigna1/126149/aug1.2_g857